MTTKSSKVKKNPANEQDAGIGGIQAPAAKLPPGNTNCPEGQMFDATTGKCVPVEGEGSMTPEAPPKVLGNPPLSDGGQSTESNGADAFELDALRKISEKIDQYLKTGSASEDDESDDEEEEEPEEETPEDGEERGRVPPMGSLVKGNGYPMPSGESTGRDNADLASARRTTAEFHRKKKLAELKAEIEANELKLKAQEQYMRKIKLVKELKSAKESAVPHFKYGTEKYDLATEVSILRPSQWFASVKAEENVMSTHLWHINKQQIFDSYAGRHLEKVNSTNWAVETSPMPEQFRRPMSATEAIAGPPANDFMRIMSEQVLVLPSGKVVTPVRQFCEVKILPPGTLEAFFYNYGTVNFAAVSEGTIFSDSSVTVKSAGGSTSPTGAMVTIPYSTIETTPIDLVTANNRAFALESVNAEQFEVLNTTYNNDSGSSGDGSNRIAKGGGSKDGFWVNGNSGAALTTASNDSTLTANDTLSFKGIMAGKNIIRGGPAGGFDVSNLILYTSVKGISDLIEDPNLDSYLSFSRPEVITEGVVEKIAGANIVASSALPALASGGVSTGVRSVLFVPGVTFGLVSGRDLTMEAQRRNELQVVYLTGTQKIAGYTKVVSSAVRISIA